MLGTSDTPVLGVNHSSWKGAFGTDEQSQVIAVKAEALSRQYFKYEVEICDSPANARNQRQPWGDLL